MPAQPQVGLLVPLSSKSTTSTAVADFLDTGHKLVLVAEPDTLQWYAVKYTANSNLDTTPIPDTFAIFDTFSAHSGRKAHLNGKVAEALLENAQTLFSTPPVIQEVEILASMVKPKSEFREEDKTAGLGVGIRVLFTAKESQVDAVKKFLRTALSVVEEEKETMAWYAIAIPGSNMFGIIDFFADEAGRNLHFQGKVAKALFDSAEELFVTAPDVVKFEVLAAKV